MYSSRPITDLPYSAVNKIAKEGVGPAFKAVWAVFASRILGRGL